MKNFIKVVIALLGIAALVYLVLDQPAPTKVEKTKKYEYCDEYVQISELPAMLDFYYFSEEEWKEKLEQENFPGFVTPGAVKWILEQTGSAEYITYRAMDYKNISRPQWNEIYEQLLDLLDHRNSIQIVEDVILQKESDTLVCASGTYKFHLEGLDAVPMTAMGFYVKGDEIIGIRSLKSPSVRIANVYVAEADQENITFIKHKAEYTLGLAVEKPKKVKGHVCDLLWENGEVSRVFVKKDTIEGNLTALDETTIEIEGYGEISRAKELPVYKTYGTVEEKELSDIVLANMKVKYVVAEESVEAILLEEPAQISRIRVLLMTEEGSPYRENIYIGADAPYQILRKDEKTDQAAESIVNAVDLFASEQAKSLKIKPRGKKGMLYLCDSAGNRISKGYQGSMEMRRYKEGFALVNEISIEQYLCAVVPSEMPVSYEMEALKAQAVCARSYAYIQLGHGDYAAFGAHVDDTTNYQVYNKQDRDPKTTDAVLDTAGMVIAYQGETAEAYYFSTSAGVTGDGEAWGLSQDPGYGYLREGLVQEGGGEKDLSDEDAFKAFIKEPDEDAYEKDLPYFRWKAVGVYTSEETGAKIKEILNVRKQRTPQNIQYYDANQKEAKDMKKFGKLVQIKVKKRSTSGVILQLLLAYEKGSVIVENEYNVRAVLGAGITELSLADGSSREASLIPSAYTTVTPLEDGTYRMVGGGYGHGIGMSQNGAQAMAQAGKSFEDILNFFFKDIEIAQISN